MKPSRRFAAFMRGWLYAAQTGYGNTRRAGLCAIAPVGMSLELGDFLEHFFGVRSGAPFDQGLNGYREAAIDNVHHTNPLRIAFARYVVALYRGRPDPTGAAHLGGAARGRAPVPARVVRGRLEVEFGGKWCEVRPWACYTFGVRSGGEFVPVNAVEWDRPAGVKTNRGNDGS